MHKISSKLSAILDKGFTHARSLMSLLGPDQLDQDNLSAIDWNQQTRGRYENWYLIVNHPERPMAFWFRYTLTAFDDQKPTEARLWSMLFDKQDPKQHLLLTTPLHLDQVSLSKSPFSVSLGQLGRLANDHASGNHREGQLEMAWDFSWKPCRETFRTVDSKLIASLVSSSRNVSPNNDIHMNGWIRVNGQQINFKDAPAHQGHTWGSKMQHRWVWCHCNSFIDEPGTVFEGVTIKKPKAGPNKAEASLYLKYRGCSYFMNSVKHIKFRNTSDFGVQHWYFTGEADDIKIEGELHPDSDNTHYVRYLDVNREELFNRNSCLGHGKIKLFRRQRETWQLETILTAEHTVAFEYVDRTPDPHLYRPHYEAKGSLPSPPPPSRPR